MAGLPKRVVFTQQTLLAARTFGDVCRISADDRYLPFGPFSHTASYKGGWLAGLLAGATVWARNSAEPGALMGLVNAEHITFMPSPPTSCRRCWRTPASSATSALLAWCKANFANYKVPRSVRLIDRLPLNASGKVLKAVLRSQD